MISPYRGVCYHFKEFSDNLPRNDKELFNLHYSSLCIPNTRKHSQPHFQDRYQTSENEIVSKKRSLENDHFP